ncbi:DJ-1/PfpI family protein [Neoaquamicrobium sediminum]|uniref:DJ-1/PfpI family protein n=1 Tax=Neoaquamicrobium sediminum TaxID=1849104 RepID=A0ABV3WXB3_9HYPH
MSVKMISLGVLGLVAVAAAGWLGWLYSLPPAPPAMAASAVPPEETQAMLAALKPPKRERPVIAIIGINDATETTDYLMPYGILRRADIADVLLVATQEGPVSLYPALTVEPDTTIAAFDAQYPEGADYVIVPAMSRDDDPAALDWIRGQSSKGAIVVGVCVGAKVVGAAGLLDGRQATTHWYYLTELLKRSPTIEHVANRRFVVDGNVATTTGITASMPMMLTLIEAIAGRDKAVEVARGLGVDTWDARHASGAFRFNRSFARTVIGNSATFWTREQLAIALEEGMDEVSLALVADAWSRTYRSKALTFAEGPITSKNGARIVPDRSGSWRGDERIADFADAKPAQVLDATLQAIEQRYGRRTTDVVAMELEYPR